MGNGHHLFLIVIVVAFLISLVVTLFQNRNAIRATLVKPPKRFSRGQGIFGLICAFSGLLLGMWMLQQQNFPGGNSSSSSTGVPSGALDATPTGPYGFKWDALSVTDLTTTITSGAVSSPTAVWSAGDIGKVFYAFANCNTGTVSSGQTPLIARTTITGFTGTHSITVGANASSSVAGTACGFWGTPDDAAAILLDAAAAASATCPLIWLPAKNTIFEKGHFNVSIPACNSLPGGLGGVLEGYGEVIQGQGKGVTRVFISPNLSLVNSATCNGGASTLDCFGGQGGQVFRNFQFDGGGFTGTAFGSAKHVFELATYSRAEDMAWYDYASSDANADFLMTGAGTVHVVTSDIIRFGLQLNAAAGGVYVMQNADVQDLCGTNIFNIAGGATVVSSGSFYSAGPCDANNTHIINVSGRFISNNDTCFNDTSANVFQCIVVNGAGVADLTGLTTLTAGSTNFLPIDNAVSGAVTTCRGCNLNGGSATVSVFGVAGSLFVDAGNNKFPQGFTAGTPVSATNLGNNCSVNSASPAACGFAAIGVFAIPTTTTSYTINTTAVTANSRIFLEDLTDNTGIPSAPTCTSVTGFGLAQITSRVAGTSFTISLPSTAGTTCFNYWIVN